MKLCIFHLASLRTALEALGEPDTPAFHQACALTYANVAETNFDFATEAPADACPYCKGIIPHDWTEKVAESIHRTRTEERNHLG